MNNFKVDWNDHISEFINIKATKPHLLAELVKLQQQHSQQKSARRKVQHLVTKYDQLLELLLDQNRRLQEITRQKTVVLAEIKRVDNDCGVLQWELLRYSKQLQDQRKSRSSRSSLAGTNYTSSQSSLALIKKDYQSKICNAQNEKTEVRNDLARLIAQRISLKEEKQLYTKRLQNLQSSNKANSQKIVLREETASLRTREEQLKARKQSLIEVHKQKSHSPPRAFKISKKEQQLLQESTKKLQGFVKEARKLIFSDKLRGSKRYMDFRQKYSDRRDSEGWQRELNELTENHLELKIISEEASAVLSLGRYEQIQRQMLAEHTKKDISGRDYLEMEENLSTTTQYLLKLERRQSVLGQEGESLRRNLQKKLAQIQNQRNRIKSNRSI